MNEQAQQARAAPEPIVSGVSTLGGVPIYMVSWDTYGWTAESVRGFDWRKVGESHPQQHHGAHYQGVWNENCLECERLREED